MGNIHSLRKLIKKIKPKPLKVIDEYEKGELMFDSFWLRNRKVFIGVKAFIVTSILTYYLLYADPKIFSSERTIQDPIREKWTELQKRIFAIDYSDERIQSKLRKETEQVTAIDKTDDSK